LTNDTDNRNKAKAEGIMAYTGLFIFSNKISLIKFIIQVSFI